jgi:hypothetical protein
MVRLVVMLTREAPLTRESIEATTRRRAGKYLIMAGVYSLP